MNKRVAAIVAVFVVSLIVWTVFYYMDLGLDRGGTFVVVGIVGLVVFGLQWLVGTLRGKAGK